MMCALPPKADIAEHRRDVRFVPKADIPSLFDHLVSDSEQIRWDNNAKSF
jgi:hypothetical protein